MKITRVFVDASPHETVFDLSKRMVEFAQQHQCHVLTYFNGTYMTADEYDDTHTVYLRWETDRKTRPGDIPM